jgi:hypothetical protein
MREHAEAAVSRLRMLPGFRDVPEGFSIGSYELDEEHWIEGFVTPIGEEETQETK